MGWESRFLTHQIRGKYEKKSMSLTLGWENKKSARSAAMLLYRGSYSQELKYLVNQMAFLEMRQGSSISTDLSSPSFPLPWNCCVISDNLLSEPGFSHL